MVKKLFALVLGVTFMLVAASAFADWYPGDPYKMHFPQYPNEWGWNVYDNEGYPLADDWMCTHDGPVDDIHFWGSWMGGNTGTINGFWVTIYSNISEDQSPTGYSMPGTVEWGPFYITDFTARLIVPDPEAWEGWLDPLSGEALQYDHTEYYQYNIVDIDQMPGIPVGPFWQEAGTMYWLGIEADVEPEAEEKYWGWKTSYLQFKDDAVYMGEGWQELTDPGLGNLNNYHVLVDRDGIVDAGASGGDYSYNDTWYEYTDVDPAWWNIWFYDHPFNPERWKEVWTNAMLSLADMQYEGYIEIAINWSTPQWSLTGLEPGEPRRPPLPDDLIGINPGSYLQRQVIYPWGPVPPLPTAIGDLGYTISAEWGNPEWVSIDVRGYNFTLDGTVTHSCYGTGPASLDLAFVITDGEGPELGACCYGDPLEPTCEDLTRADCQNLNGVWYPGQTCADFICPTTHGELKWQSEPDLERGDDVTCTHNPNSPYPTPYLLAADFLCKQTGQITEIHVFGSWYLDNLPYEEPTNVRFTLSIHEDIPASPPEIEYSRPGDLVCLIEDVPFEVVLYRDGLHEGWLEPPDYWTAWPDGDETCWLYKFDLTEYTDCIQEGTPDVPVVYWLDVQAFPDDQTTWFGWKTSWPPWNDDACYAFVNEDPSGIVQIDWQELRFPNNHDYYPGQSADLAFAVFGEEEEPQTGACCYDDGDCTDGMTEADCVSGGGIYGGDGSSCANQDLNNNGVDDYCDGYVVLGACCYDDPDVHNQTCVNTTQTVCGQNYYGTWYGAGSDCVTTICPVPQGACCHGDPVTCTNTGKVDCENNLLGTWYAGEDCLGGTFECPTHGEPKWHQFPDLECGTDVNCTDDYQFPIWGPKLLASDFRCEEYGRITEIWVYGSWASDHMPYEDDPSAVSFTLSIHEDIPAGPTHSMPGELKCLIEEPPFHVEMYFQGPPYEGFFSPPETYNPESDLICWLYKFDVSEYDCFQEGSEGAAKIYWLDVQARHHGPMMSTFYFGWKTTTPDDVWNDDACWADGRDQPGGPAITWHELIMPAQHICWPNQSVDLAFAIFGIEEEPPIGACCYDDGDCADDMTESACIQSGGLYAGNGTGCAGTDNNGNGVDDACDGTVTLGACCWGDPHDPTCTGTTETICEDPAQFGGTWYAGEDCAAFGCPVPQGACCYGDPVQCANTGKVECENPAGQYNGTWYAGEDCATFQCPSEPTGACCLDGGTACSNLTESECVDASGEYRGDGTVCGGDADGNGIIDICEDKVQKWEQPPDLTPTGIDMYAMDDMFVGTYVLADDFLCRVTGPITEIHVWGSWYHDELPSAPPWNVGFTLSIHSDIPAGPAPSMPGELLCLYHFEAADFEVREWPVIGEEGFMIPPFGPLDYEAGADSRCFEYIFQLPDEECVQRGTEQEPVIYWLDVQAHTQMQPAFAYFGWKTTHLELGWNDAAVFAQGHEPILEPAWQMLIYPDQHPWRTMPINLAFSIYSIPETECCEGRVGDANDNGVHEPTIGDVTAMIDAKFITGNCLNIPFCIPEADVNLSGTLVSPPLDCDDITIGDIIKVIDYLFITGKDNWDEGYGLGNLPPCP